MELNFAKGQGLVPAIVQHAHSRAVLMLGFMNREAYAATLQSGRVTFFSRTKQRLWMKGEESGKVLMVKEIRADCDNDTLLILAVPTGPVCHTGTNTCFGNIEQQGFLYALETIIHRRIETGGSGSYSRRLYREGLPRIAQKTGEEAIELLIAALGESRADFLAEAADVLYHLLLLLRARDCSLADVEKILQERHQAGSTAAPGPNDAE